MIRFGKWIYNPKSKAVSHSESEWRSSLKNITHFSDVDELVATVAEWYSSIFDQNLSMLMNQLFWCDGCDPDYPVDMQALLDRNAESLGAKSKPAPSKPSTKKKPKPVKR